jgi:hypothetical protein
MALKPKNPDQAPGNGAQSPASDKEPLELKTNPEVERRLAEYKTANSRSVEYFTRLVREAPDRAVNFHFLDKMQQHEADTREAMRQMPNAKSIYHKMTPASKERVDKVLADVNPYNHAKRFVAAVRKEMNRVSFGENRKALRSPGAAVG